MSSQTALVCDTVAFGVALVISLLLTPAVRNFAVNHRFLDLVGSVRKIHTQSIPRLGGVAIVTAWLIAAGFMLAMQPAMRDVFWRLHPRMTVFIIGGLVAAGLGMVDDLRGLRARHKLAVQLAIGALLCWGGFTVHELQLPGNFVLHLGPFAVPFTMLWVAGVMNAMNLIDGLDGLAAGVAGIALTTTFVLALATSRPLIALYTAALLGAVIGFLVYNFNPASIFMGDTGALFLGYFLSVALLVPARAQSWRMVELAVPLAILGVPIVDTMLAIARRALRGRGLFSPDRGHLHHRLLALGMSHRQAVLTIYAASVALAAGAAAMGFGDGYVDILVCVALFAAAVTALRLLGVFDLPLKALRMERKRNFELRATVNLIRTKLQHVAGIDDVFDSIHQLAPALSASAVRARIGSVSFSDPPAPFSGRPFEAHFSLGDGVRQFGDVVIVWGDGRERLEEDQALAIEEVCENIARTVRRVSPEAFELPPVTPALELVPVRRRSLGG